MCVRLSQCCYVGSVCVHVYTWEHADIERGTMAMLLPPLTTATATINTSIIATLNHHRHHLLAHQMVALNFDDSKAMTDEKRAELFRRLKLEKRIGWMVSRCDNEG